MSNLPYSNLLNEIDQPLDYNNLTLTFKTWINNITRLNATNMNALVGYIQGYTQELGNLIDSTYSLTLQNFIEQNAGWKVQVDTINQDGSRTVNKGELFNDYVNNTAEGLYSHAQGTNTSASGQASSAAGSYTTAGYSNQFVIGTYNNNLQTNIFEIGGGSSNSDRLNLFSVDSSGYAYTSTSNLLENSPDNTLTPKGYIDKQIENLDKNVWLGYIEVTTEQYHAEDDTFTNLLNEAVKTFTVDTNPPDGRDPKNGDQITVKISNPTTSDPQYPEVWMFRDPDPKPGDTETDTTPGRWVFFSSIQQLVNASTTSKGLVQIGDNISVNGGIISIPIATDTALGLIKLSSTMQLNNDNQLIMIWQTWDLTN